MNNCNICDELSGQDFSSHGPEYKAIVQSRKNILASTKNFHVLPSIGPLHRSHVMIVPKVHCNSFGQLPFALNLEKLELVNCIRAYFSSLFDHQLIFFESGAGRLINHSGGCIFHAHIHAVVENSAFHERLLREVKLIPTDSFTTSDMNLELGYIWYMDANKSEYLCNNPMLPSQFLRYTYAQSTEVETLWNWRRHANISGVLNVLETYKHLENCCSVMSPPIN